MFDDGNKASNWPAGQHGTKDTPTHLFSSIKKFAGSKLTKEQIVVDNVLHELFILYTHHFVATFLSLEIKTFFQRDHNKFYDLFSYCAFENFKQKCFFS